MTSKGIETRDKTIDLEDYLYGTVNWKLFTENLPPATTTLPSTRWQTEPYFFDPPPP